MENFLESHFHVIDVETANADFSSICQLGVAEFKNGELVSTWETLLNPEDYFDSMNTSIHGISSVMVEHSPTFPEVLDELQNKIGGKILFHHMPFDKVALNRALLKYQLKITNPVWVDSAKVVRRTWSECSSSGYGLKSITKSLDIKFKHHNALEDAIATGKVVLKALEKNNWCIEDCIQRIEKPINLYKNGSTSIKMDGVPDGPLYGENIVFTGYLFLTRAEAGKLAANLGCNVTNSVTKKTTILIVGTQESFKLNGYQKSSKHRKAEELLLKGNDLKIMSEDDFRDLLHS
jgi:DNA polymerase-3 subunit epsilon